MESALKNERLDIKVFLLTSWIVIFMREVAFIAMYGIMPIDFPSKSITRIISNVF